jgi:hypothetical protein
MAFIYLSSGQVLRVSESREAVESDLQGAEGQTVLRYDVDIPVNGATRPMAVSVLAMNIAAVADQPLPSPLSVNPYTGTVEART